MIFLSSATNKVFQVFQGRAHLLYNMWWSSASLCSGNSPTVDGTGKKRIQEESRAGEREGAREGEGGHREDGDGEAAAGRRLQGNVKNTRVLMCSIPDCFHSGTRTTV